MINVAHLTRKFGDFVAVDDLTFHIDSGEVVGFLGPNGAGKSTTMKMLVGFLPPTSGQVSVVGTDLLQDPLTVKAAIGYLPEGAPLYGDMTPRRLLRFVAAVRGLTGSAAERRIDEVVARIQLHEVLDQSIETLSKGFKRRVGLAQAILHDPPVLILDEPTDGLDPNQKSEVRQLIQELSADKAIILSTHILEEVEAVCTRVLLIARGRLLADETPADLAARSPRHNLVRLRLAGRIEGAQSVLAACAEVASVSPVADLDDPAVTELLIAPQAGEPLLPRLQQIASQQGWELLALQTLTGSLDEVFRDLTVRVDGRETRT